MRRRPAVVLTATVVAALVAATAFALDDPARTDEPVPAAASADDSSSPDDSPSPDSPSPDDEPSDESTPSPSTVATGSETYPVADAGTLTVAANADGLVVSALAPASGWRTFVEVPEGREIEVTFRSSDARVDFKAEIEEGGVRIRVRDRRVDEADDAAEEESDAAEDEDQSGREDDD